MAAALQQPRLWAVALVILALVHIAAGATATEQCEDVSIVVEDIQICVSLIADPLGKTVTANLSVDGNMVLERAYSSANYTHAESVSLGSLFPICTAASMKFRTPFTIENTNATLCPTIQLTCTLASPKVDVDCFYLDYDEDPHALPLLPNDWSSVIEANIIDRNMSIEVREFYDFEFDRVRVENHFGNSSIVQIFAYDEQRMYDINMTGNTCRVRNTTRRGGRGGGGSGAFDQSTGHLMLTRDLFEEARQHPYSYLGQNTSRGILCDVWRSLVRTNFTDRQNRTGQLNYSLDWYFAVQEWSFRFADDRERIPVTAYLEGQRIMGPNISSFAHNYEFTQFDPSQPDPSIFEIPRRVLCVDITDPPLPVMGEEVFMDQEITFSNRGNRTVSFTEYFDYKGNRFRTDGADDDHSRYSIIVDGNKDLEYRWSWNELTGKKTCEVTAFNNSRAYDPAKHHLRHIAPGLRSMPDGGSPIYVYNGEKVARGIVCNHWSYNYTGTLDTTRGSINVSYSYDVYFKARHWDYHNITQSVPIRARIIGTITHANGSTDAFTQDIEYTDVSYDKLDPDVFITDYPCPSNAARIMDNGLSRNTLTGTAVGIGILSVIAGFVAHLAWSKRNPQRAPKKSVVVH